MITEILEALEKGRLINNHLTVIEDKQMNTQEEEYNETIEQSRESKRHCHKLKSVISYERSGLKILQFEGIHGTFMLNTIRGTAIYNSKLKSSKATERLIHKQLLPPDLSLNYLIKVEHICHLGSYHERVQRKLKEFKQLNHSAQGVH